MSSMEMRRAATSIKSQPDFAYLFKRSRGVDIHCMPSMTEVTGVMRKQVTNMSKKNMRSIVRFTQKSPLALSGGGKKATSYGVMTATMMRASMIAMSHPLWRAR